jgi:hemolysin-activating ACP:hemolysin acyltransferase
MNFANFFDQLELNTSEIEKLAFATSWIASVSHGDILGLPLAEFLDSVHQDFSRQRIPIKFDLLGRASIETNDGYLVTRVDLSGLTASKYLRNKAAAFVSRHVETGLALSALAVSRQYLKVPVGVVRSSVLHAQSTRQFKTFRDSNGVPKGFLSWAWLSNYSLARLESNASLVLHPSEWNEGEILCFRDIAFTEESLARVSIDLGGALFCEESICYVTLGVAGQPKLVRLTSGDRSDFAVWLGSQLNQAPASIS